MFTQECLTQECPRTLYTGRDLGHLNTRQKELVPEVKYTFYVSFFPMYNLLNFLFSFFFFFLVACFKNNIHIEDWFLSPQLSFANVKDTKEYSMILHLKMQQLNHNVVAKCLKYPVSTTSSKANVTSKSALLFLRCLCSTAIPLLAKSTK